MLFDDMWENNWNGGGSWSATVDISTSVYQFGSASLHINIMQGGGFKAGTISTPAVANSYTHFSFWIRAANTSTSLHIYFQVIMVTSFT